MMICIGGVCIPLNLLIPFLIGLAHRNGWLKFIKEEWFTPAFWRRQYASWTQAGTPAAGPSNAGSRNDSMNEKRASDRELQQQKAEVKDMTNRYSRKVDSKKQDDKRSRKEQ